MRNREGNEDVDRAGVPASTGRGTRAPYSKTNWRVSGAAARGAGAARTRAPARAAGRAAGRTTAARARRNDRRANGGLLVWAVRMTQRHAAYRRTTARSAPPRCPGDRARWRRRTRRRTWLPERAQPAAGHRGVPGRADDERGRRARARGGRCAGSGHRRDRESAPTPDRGRGRSRAASRCARRFRDPADRRGNEAPPIPPAFGAAAPP